MFHSFRWQTIGCCSLLHTLLKSIQAQPVTVLWPTSEVQAGRISQLRQCWDGRALVLISGLSLVGTGHACGLLWNDFTIFLENGVESLVIRLVAASAELCGIDTELGRTAIYFGWHSRDPGVVQTEIWG